MPALRDPEKLGGQLHPRQQGPPHRRQAAKRRRRRVGLPAAQREQGHPSQPRRGGRRRARPRQVPPRRDGRDLRASLRHRPRGARARRPEHPGGQGRDRPEPLCGGRRRGEPARRARSHRGRCGSPFQKQGPAPVHQQGHQPPPGASEEDLRAFAIEPGVGREGKRSAQGDGRARQPPQDARAQRGRGEPAAAPRRDRPESWPPPGNPGEARGHGGGHAPARGLCSQATSGRETAQHGNRGQAQGGAGPRTAQCRYRKDRPAAEASGPGRRHRGDPRAARPVSQGGRRPGHAERQASAEQGGHPGAAAGARAGPRFGNRKGHAAQGCRQDPHPEARQPP